MCKTVKKSKNYLKRKARWKIAAECMILSGLLLACKNVPPAADNTQADDMSIENSLPDADTISDENKQEKTEKNNSVNENITNENGNKQDKAEENNPIDENITDKNEENKQDKETDQNKQEDKQDKETDQNKQENLEGVYLSITETRWNNGVNSSGGMTTMEFVYDLPSGEIEEMGAVAYTSQYPLAVYSRQDDVLYFTADEETGKNRDQVYCLNRKTGDVYQLTEGLFAINEIIPTKDQVVIIAVDTKERNLSPYIYEKATGEVTKVDVYEDFSVRCCSYHPDTKRLFLGGYLESENYRLMIGFNTYLSNTGLDYFTTPYTPADGYIFELIDEYKTAKEILHTNHQGVEIGMPSDKEGKLYLKLSHVGPQAQAGPKTEPAVLDISTGELKDYDYFEGLSDIFRCSYYTKYEEDYYILGSGREDDSPYPRGIYRYHPGSEPELIYQAAENGYINQFLLCKDSEESNFAFEKAKKVQLQAAGVYDNTDDLAGLPEEDSAERQIEDFVFALPDEEGIVESRLLPGRMQPNSKIYFIDEAHFVILQGGLYYDTQEKVDEQKQVYLNELKECQEKGIIYTPFTRPDENSMVVYDGEGYIYHVYHNLTLEEAKKK